MFLRKTLVFLAVLAIAFWGVSAPSAAESVSLSAASAVLYEPTSGLVLYEKEAHTVRPMASTTKLMTALVGADHLLPEQSVTVAPQAVLTEGSSLGLKAGDRLTARDLITGMLLASGNDAANAVALAVSDTVTEFADQMNRTAQKLGMKNTCFVTPSGLDAPGHASTAYDLALLGAAVLEQPMLREICCLKTAQIPIVEPSRTLYVRNHNKLLSLYNGCVGLKTGFTKQSGRCLVSAVQRDGYTLVAVTLNAADDWNDHIALYDYGFSRLERAELPAVTLPDLPVLDGVEPQVALVAESPSPPVCLKGEGSGWRAVIDLPGSVQAPVKAGQTLGTVHYCKADGRTVFSVPITAGYAVEQVPQPTFWERLWQWFWLLLQCT